jgi:DNA-binding NarL/FixJ family response regulator
MDKQLSGKEQKMLGQVVGEAEDGSKVDAYTLTMKQVDIVIIDLLMPDRDGIETVRELLPSYSGKIIMLSQVGYLGTLRGDNIESFSQRRSDYQAILN